MSLHRALVCHVTSRTAAMVGMRSRSFCVMATRTVVTLKQVAWVAREEGLEKPAWPYFLLPLVVYLAILPWSTAQRPPDGDEPYYLLLTHSLAYDGDTVTLRGSCGDGASDYRISFGECSGTILPAPPGEP